MKMELNLVLNRINSKFFVKMILEPKNFKLRKKSILRSDQKLHQKPRRIEKLKLRPKRLFLKSRIKQQQLTTTLKPNSTLPTLTRQSYEVCLEIQKALNVV